MSAGYRSLLLGVGGRPPRRWGYRSLFAFWSGGGATTGAVIPVVVAARQGWQPRRIRRSKEYEEYLRAIAEGREYAAPGVRTAPPRRARQVGDAGLPLADFAAYTGDFAADLGQRSEIAVELAAVDRADWSAAYAAARLAYVRAVLAWWREEDRRRQEEDAVLVLLLVA